MTVSNNLKVCWALTLRELKVIRALLSKYIIDSAVYISLMYILFVKLLPTMGMDKSLSGPLFIGNISMQIMFIGYFRLIQIQFTLSRTTLLQYYWSLPISKWWLFTQQVFAVCLHLFVTTFPMAMIGTFIMTDHVYSWSQFFIIYISSCIFYSLLFSFLAYRFDQRWLWDRFLNFMLGLGGVFFTWKILYKNAPYVAKAILINPTLYVSEGLRTTVVHGDKYLPFNICMLMLTIFSLILIPLLAMSIKKKLDPVWPVKSNAGENNE